jgi:hypothetical protein
MLVATIIRGDSLGTNNQQPETKQKPNSAELSARFEAVEHLVKQNESLFQTLQTSLTAYHSRLTLIMGIFLSFVSALSILLGLGTVFNAYLQSGRIDDAVQSASKRVDDLVKSTKPQEIESVSILNIIDDKDVLYAEPSLGYNILQGNFYTFQIIVQFHVRVMISGTGQNHINGLSLKYSNDYVSKVFTNSVDIANASLMTDSVMSLGSAIPIGPNAYYQVDFNTTDRARDCREIQRRIDSILAQPDLGTVTITPIFDIQPKTSATRVMRIVPRDFEHLFSCADIEALQKKGEQNSAKP